MSAPVSIRTRLLAGVVGAQLLLAVGLVWIGIGFTRRQLRQAFDSHLLGRGTSIAALVRYPESGRRLVFDQHLLPPARHARFPPFYRVNGPGGAVVADTFPAHLRLPVPAGEYWDFRYDGVPYRGLVLSDFPILDTEENLTGPPARLNVYYAAPMLDIDAEVAAVGVSIGLASLILLLLTSFLAAWIIGRGLAPLRELAQQAASISPHNWRFQPGIAAAGELQPLIAALDRMLLRLHAADQQQRAFMADAAHHLKTPVTILKSSLQNLLQRPRSPAEYEAITSASLQDLERLERLLHNMLGLARLDQRRQQLDAAALAELPRVAVSETCQAALERVAPLARQAQVELRGLGLETAVWVRAEGDELEQLWVNLLENAVQQSPAGGVVAIECVAGAQAGTVRVAVRDQGSGIAAEEAPFIFERFRRGTNSRPGGFGLGLAIARSTAESCGGSIEVTPSPCGAIFQVQLPTVP